MHEVATAITQMGRTFYKTHLICIITSLAAFCAALLICCNRSKAVGGNTNANKTVGGKNSLKLCSWNVQTFFDAVDDGTEYGEFRGSKSNWSEEAYKERLTRLCRSMAAINADVFAFMEIENEGVIRDIDNTFALVKWGKNPYHYACFDKGADDATGCAVLSRYPLDGLTVHNIDIRTHTKQPPLRSIMCVRVQKGSGITLIINHWKSKSGGKEETEYWRRYQESELASLFLEHGGVPTVACGDFNRDLLDFDTDGTLVRLHDIRGATCADVTSAWSIADGGRIDAPPLPSAPSSADDAPGRTTGAQDTGSYYYKGRWERIDHIFVNSLVSIDSFAVLNKGDWATSEGKPRRYMVNTRAGYTDHLPIQAILRW